MLSELGAKGLGCPGPVPSWADKYLGGEIELYAQLCTRDGRRFGNGIVIGVEEETFDDVTFNCYTILTDFGNQIVLSAEQVQRGYHLPEFRMKKHLVEFRTGSMEAYLAIERTVYF